MPSLLASLALSLAACAHERGGAIESGAPAVAQTRAPRVLAGSPQPVLFTGPEADAPVFGFVVSDTEVLVDGPAQGGRVPVRIDGPLRVKAHVPESALALRVQRRGRVRGTPTYVGPNDLVTPLGPAVEPERTRVSVTPRIPGTSVGPFEGTYPTRGLAAQPADATAEPPQEGRPYFLPPGRKLALHEAPNGPLILELPARSLPLEVTVVAEEQGWLAVRIGEGPYLIGYTQGPLAPQLERAPAPPPAEGGGLPKLLANETGPIKRIAANTRVLFNQQVVAVFKVEGTARVLAEYPDGQVDVFAAVDDHIAVRGLVPATSLTDVKSSPGGGAFPEPSEP